MYKDLLSHSWGNTPPRWTLTRLLWLPPAIQPLGVLWFLLLKSRKDRHFGFSSMLRGHRLSIHFHKNGTSLPRCHNLLESVLISIPSLCYHSWKKAHFVSELFAFKIQLPWVVRVTKSQLLSMLVTWEVRVLRGDNGCMCICVDFFLTTAGVCLRLAVRVTCRTQGSLLCVFLSESWAVF